MLLTAYFFFRVMGAIGREASVSLWQWAWRKTELQPAKFPSLNPHSSSVS
jgi:hypothetical protein